MTFRIHPVLALLLACSLAPALAQPVPRDEPGFTEHLAQLLRQRIPDAPIVPKGPLALGVGELVANLGRLYGFCQQRSFDCQGELENFARAVADVHRDRTAPPSREMVRLVIRPAGYGQGLGGPGGGNAAVQPGPFVEGLVSLPALDSPRTLRMLGPKDNELLGLTEAQVRALGLDNLRRTLPPLMQVARPATAGQVGQIVGDSYESSRLLLVDSWAPLAEAQGGVLIVAIPAPDTVVYVGEESPATLEALRDRVLQVASRVPNPLSGHLLRWRPAGWERLR